MTGRDVKRDAIVQLIIGVVEAAAYLFGRIRRRREKPLAPRVDIEPIEPPRGNVTIIELTGERREL